MTTSKTNGALAHLARAFDWQSKGHRFDSDILHPDYERVTEVKICDSFLFARILPEDGKNGGKGWKFRVGLGQLFVENAGSNSLQDWHH